MCYMCLHMCSKWLFGRPYVKCPYFLTESTEIGVLKIRRVSVTASHSIQNRFDEATSNKRYVNHWILCMWIFVSCSFCFAVTLLAVLFKGHVVKVMGVASLAELGNCESPTATLRSDFISGKQKCSISKFRGDSKKKIKEWNMHL